MSVRSLRPQLDLVRDGFALAEAMNRTLVLPKLFCLCDHSSAEGEATSCKCARRGRTHNSTRRDTRTPSRRALGRGVAGCGCRAAPLCGPGTHPAPIGADVAAHSCPGIPPHLSPFLGAER